MKTLILIRHAKSSWDEPVIDSKRDLAQKGIVKALKVALFTKKMVNSDAVVWSSYAKRAHKTAILFLENWGWNVSKIEIIKELYTFDSAELEQIVKSCQNDCNNLILFGHNNAITDFVNKFGDVFIDNVPTAGFVSIDFDTDSWSKISKGKTIEIIVPRDI
ncbi:SixA phosphatase family protein [Flavobacterium aquatile]|uniref:Phosphohistidine phosphatase n=1 Tax=Flavobacterium aquatile LMG 4008 = ATCC 11947 TaxID=1453498 RepID=A0A095SU12_9FLAO|nr:phosphoglycerate mutase family protein [Flavobacterium aquatile]KGD67879.1 phosphohistidine phosphatase [Flavobacterium aquatile LMG 4008 = ATCC 11947]OXA67741.1 histidine phosphatase family protein [Flavobacterium aquatile LMG 4008 = ATCC 11947]GEC79990.1 phosphohistidine phosphatase SixA [Flavobacterium aquatile]